MHELPARRRPAVLLPPLLHNPTGQAGRSAECPARPGRAPPMMVPCRRATSAPLDRRGSGTALPRAPEFPPFRAPALSARSHPLGERLPDRGPLRWFATSATYIESLPRPVPCPPDPYREPEPSVET